MKLRLLPCLTFTCACLTMATLVSSQLAHAGGDPERLGKVSFSISCDPVVQPLFNRAVAMLHSFWFAKAEEEFSKIAEKDPACGMAYWGVAMTHYLLLLQAFSQTDQEQGWTAVQKAKSAGAKTERERDYVSAVEILYKDGDKVDQGTRAVAYEQKMEQIHARYPQDEDATLFYALAVWANSPRTDKTFANQRKAGEIVQEIFRKEPDHPGAAHYLIHCYDKPSLAESGLDAARRYAQIAPDSPHALHMPSHIFVRLGLWQDSIESNRASAASARKSSAVGDEFHASDYLVYAYLQVAQDREAKRILESLPRVETDDPLYFASLYATAAIPARYAVERHQWAEAAALSVPPNTFPGGRYAWAEANLDFARALGALRIKNMGLARSERKRLAELREAMNQAKDEYWAGQLSIQLEIVDAWMAFAEGKNEEAVRQIHVAADHEDATEKSGVTPGVILPARELLGEVLLEVKQPTQALAEFEATLHTTPNRFNALYGAARAAELAGNLAKARMYFTRLVNNCKGSESDRPELAAAKSFLQKQDVTATSR